MGLPGDLSTTAAVAGSSWHRHVRMPPPEHRFDSVNVPPFKRPGNQKPRSSRSEVAICAAVLYGRFYLRTAAVGSIHPDRLPATYEAIDLTRT
jgi:hypothetical protein